MRTVPLIVRRRRAAAPWLVGLAILVLGVVVVTRFPIWAEIDERAHYSYVQSVAEEQRLPLIDDLVSSEVQAITDKTWPRSSTRSGDGLAGRSYEAFQPPLYYLLAAPAFAVVPDHRQKVFALRYFNLALVGLAGALLVLLAKGTVAPQHRPVAIAAGLLVLAWPGVLVRAVTVSNAPLELVVAPAFLLTAWLAVQRRTGRLLLASGVLLGLCLLTKLTLVFLAPALLVAAATFWRARPNLRGRIPAVAALAAPPVLLAPWLLANRSRVGDWTANTQARTQQIPFLYPEGAPRFDFDDVPDRAITLLDGVLPQEWDAQLGVWWIGLGARALVVLVLAATLAALLCAQPTTRRQVAFFAMPLAVGGAITAWTLVFADWDIFLLRYFQPILPASIVVATAALAARHPAWARSGTAVAAVLIAALWVDMAGAFLFTDIGDRLGI